MANSEELDQEIRRMSQNWAAKLGGRFQSIEQAAIPLLEGRADSASLVGLRDLLHKVAGAGSSFGFPDVTHTARAAEYTAKKLIEQGSPPAAADIDGFRHQLESLRVACAAATSR